MSKDTELAIIGDSGNTFGRHLHFEVIHNGKRINPTFYLLRDFENKDAITYQAYDHVKKDGSMKFTSMRPMEFFLTLEILDMQLVAL